MRKSNGNIRLLGLVVLILLNFEFTFGQLILDPTLSLGGPSHVCSDDDIQSYSIMFEHSQSESCINYFWSVTGGTIQGSANNSTVTVNWNASGTITVFITSSFDDAPFTPCEELNESRSLYVTYTNISSGGLSLSNNEDQELCTGETASITASVSGSFAFRGWYKNDETTPYTNSSNLVVTQSSLTDPVTRFTAKADNGPILNCFREEERSIIIFDGTEAAKGTIQGDAKVLQGLRVSGEIIVFGENMGTLDHWERRIDTGQWEDLGAATLNNGEQVFLNLGSTGEDDNFYRFRYEGTFQERTEFRAVLNADCGGQVTSDIATVEVLDYAPDYHSVTITNFAEEQTVVSKTAQFFDQEGTLLQSQTINLEEGEVLANQPLWDQFRREVGETLMAPVGRQDLGFKPGFITSNNLPYTYENFENKQLPDAVDSDVPGTLGNYYSDNTKYPYFVGDFYKDGSGESKTSSQPSDVHYVESGNNAIQKELPVFEGELPLYKEIREVILDVPNQPALSNIMKQVVIDGNGNEFVSYIDESGNTIATCISSRWEGEGAPAVNAQVPDGEFIEFHNSNTWVSTDGRRYFDVVNEVWVPSENPGNGIYAGLQPGIFRYTNTSGTTQNVVSTFYYHNFTYHFYDEKGQLAASMTPNGTKQLIDQGNLAGISTASDLLFTTLNTYDLQGRLTSVIEPDAGKTEYRYRKDGQIRFSKNADQSENLYSYTNYDNLGRPTESGVVNSAHSPFSTASVESVGAPGFTSQWVRTYYDEPVPFSLTSDFTGDYASLSQSFVQGAISSTESESVQSWYSYDEQGRVVWFLQYVVDLGKYFLIEYEYDFLGNVVKVGFQPQTFYCGANCETNEAFWHAYTYDKNHRLKTVKTSENNATWYHQATYEYELHGPLKRIELASDLQGIDYSYTSQGWLKAINHPLSAEDPGKDGMSDPTQGHEDFSKDIFGMTLEYYTNDYSANGIDFDLLNADGNEYPDLVTGNIRGTVFGAADRGEYTINDYPLTLELSSFSDQVVYAQKSIVLKPGFDTNGASFQTVLGSNPTIILVDGSNVNANAYKYDEKYQLLKAKHGLAIDLDNSDNSFDVNISGYDENGNIGDIQRYGEDPTDLKHDFQFHYDPTSNRLDRVDGYISSITYSNAGQIVGINYESDDQTDVSIEYETNGKVAEVKELGTANVLMEILYDERGFRLMKRVGDVENWYLRDAAGQVIAIYNKLNGQNSVSPIELPIYGVDRIGMALRNPDHYKYLYELTDHLGSVRAVITKLGLQATASMETDTNSNGIDEHEAQFFDNLTASRVGNESYLGTKSSRLDPNNPVGPTTTFQVKAGDEVNFLAWAKYSQGGHSSGTGGIGDMLDDLVNDDVVGLETSNLTDAVSANIGSLLSGVSSTGSTHPKAYLQFMVFNEAFELVSVSNNHIKVEQGVQDEYNEDWKVLSLSHQVENDGYVYAYLVNESDKEVYFDDFTFSVQGTRAIRKTDYYPFGAVAKQWTSQDQTQQESYRHDYQGQYAEKDSTTGWSAFELRMYDPLIGRWLQVDPAREFASPYLGMANNPLNGTDPDGADWFENENGDIRWYDWFDGRAGDTHNRDNHHWKWISASENLIVGTHNRKYSRDGVSEPLNTATFHLYDASVSHFDPISAIVGNTVPSDPSVSGTLREGVYNAEFASRNSYQEENIEDLAILLRDPKTNSFYGLPTTGHLSGKLTIGEIFIHMANNEDYSLYIGTDAYSTGCQTTGCYPGSRKYHNAFFSNINDGWKGQYYLRRSHRTFHTYGSGPPER